MSVKYTPVQWNRFKWGYDAVLLIAVALFLWIAIGVAPGLLSHDTTVSRPIFLGRAFGACAFLMMSVVLCIGPLARLDTRFLPLLYNRRHFGVMTAVVASSHFYYLLNWYFVFSPIDKYQALLASNTSYGSLIGFPFEAFGIFALLVLLILAATSHDFWMKFLTPPVWKGLHYLIYPAFASVVAHVAWGALQSRETPVFGVIVYGAALGVAGLHLLAAWKMRATATPATDWVPAGAVGTIAQSRARIVILAGGARVAIFRNGDTLSAISNACAHQNGPLGEGRILNCLVTCPWHGFQYDVTNGRSPAPYTEMVPTYRLRVAGGTVLVNPQANPPGTYVEPIPALEDTP